MVEFKLSVGSYHKFLDRYVPGGSIPAWKLLSNLQLSDLDEKRKAEHRARIAAQKAEMTRQRKRAERLGLDLRGVSKVSEEAIALERMLRG